MPVCLLYAVFKILSTLFSNTLLTTAVMSSIIDTEINKYVIQITQKNYPHTTQLGDVTEIDRKVFMANLEKLQKAL